MLKHLIVVSTLALFLSPALSASDRSDDTARTQKAAEVLTEIMHTPEKGIPHDLLVKAKCIAVIPGDKKFAFVFGGNYGRGVASCRTAHGWSAPLFLAVEGGSVGYQIGGSSTDLVLLFMNQRALESLLKDKFQLGGDASIAAGPVGRTAQASTDLVLKAEILSYSRSRGIFAGVSLDGSVVKADQSGDNAYYGPHASRRDILSGRVRNPEPARAFESELRRYAV